MDAELLLEEQVDELVEIKEKVNKAKHLFLYNDDVNTFDFVIEVLIKVCGHNTLQAEQCAMITHYNGKCSVKEGSVKKLRPICEALHERGLSANIEE